jgi:hypothetical protein
VSEKLQQVHVRINDAATGKPTPVRVRFTDEAGNYYPPMGRLRHITYKAGAEVGGNIRIEGDAWAYVEGAFEILLQPGRVRVQVAKGPEYRAIDEWMTAQAGRLSMRLTIERMIDMRAEGWHSGDAAVHLLSPHAALLEAAGEDLAVLNLLITEEKTDEVLTLTNICAFSGQEPALTLRQHMVAVNTHNQSDLGNLILLHAHRLVFPLSFWSETDSWILEDWCDQCHRKKGLVIADDWLECLSDDMQSELLAEIVRGKIDAVLGWTDELAVQPWYDLLNAGLRIPVAAGSLKKAVDEVVGTRRTYAYVGTESESPSYRDWIEAVRAGRSFFTNGPLLLARFGEFLPGDVVSAERAKQGLDFNVAVRSAVPVEDVEIVFNGQVIDRVKGEKVSSSFTLNEGTGGWIAARCTSPDGKLWAHTNPIYIEGDAWPQRAEARTRLSAKIERMLAWARQPGNVADDRAREHLIQVHLEAKSLLRP